MNSKEFYSNGKLLLTGEYLVMEGARALAVPVKYGQSLHADVLPGNPSLEWNSHIKGKPWFKATFRLPTFNTIQTTNDKIANNLIDIFRAAVSMNSTVISHDYNFRVKTELSFDINWGLGSSSSLISNIAYWFDIDPYELFWKVSNGSGYDIACARSYKPVIYRLYDQEPVIEKSSFNPDFKKKLYFVYTGKKAITSKGIQTFKSDRNFNTDDIQMISDLTAEMSKTSQLTDFERIIQDHENIISKILKTKRIKEEFFHDFEGEIKSLVAWGGDFVMVTWMGKREKLEEYFKKKGLETVFRYDEMVL